MKVQDAMTAPALMFDPDTPLEEAAALLFSTRSLAAPIVEHDALIGIVGEADLYRAVAAANGISLGGTVPYDTFGRPRTVADIMRRGVLWVQATDNIMLAAQMLMRHARSLPVLDRGRVVGSISRSEVIGPVTRGRVGNVTLRNALSLPGTATDPIRIDQKIPAASGRTQGARRAEPVGATGRPAAHQRLRTVDERVSYQTNP